MKIDQIVVALHCANDDDDADDDDGCGERRRGTIEDG